MKFEQIFEKIIIKLIKLVKELLRQQLKMSQEEFEKMLKKDSQSGKCREALIDNGKNISNKNQASLLIIMLRIYDFKIICLTSRSHLERTLKS